MLVHREPPQNVPSPVGDCHLVPRHLLVEQAFPHHAHVVKLESGECDRIHHEQRLFDPVPMAIVCQVQRKQRCTVAQQDAGKRHFYTRWRAEEVVGWSLQSSLKASGQRRSRVDDQILGRTVLGV